MNNTIFETVLDRTSLKGLPVFQVEVSELETFDDLSGAGLPNGAVVVFRKDASDTAVRVWNALEGSWDDTTLGITDVFSDEIDLANEPADTYTYIPAVNVTALIKATSVGTFVLNTTDWLDSNPGTSITLFCASLAGVVFELITTGDNYNTTGLMSLETDGTDVLGFKVTNMGNGDLVITSI
jgi:hypothetical protein